MIKSALGLFGRVPSTWFLYLCAFALLLFIAVPFLWVLSASFQWEKDLFRQPPHWIPDDPTIENYVYVFTGKLPSIYEAVLLRERITQQARQLGPAILNSLIVAIFVTMINLALGTTAAYTFARETFRGRNGALMFILGSRLLPPVAVAIPMYMIVNRLGLLDTKQALVMMNTAFTLPFTIGVLTLYIRNLPREIEESALLDGCTRFATLRHIVIPLSTPALTAVGAFAFLFSYSEFVFALFTTQSINAKTVAVVTSAVSTNPAANYSMVSVGVILSIIPPIIVALSFRRFLVYGLAASLGQ